VRLELTEDQRSVERAFEVLFARESTMAVVRDSEPLGFAPALWSRLVETGAAEMSVGVAVGGGGAGLLEAALVAEVAGRHLAPVPLAEHLVTTRLLERAGASDALDAVFDGSAPVTLALRPFGSEPQLVPAGAVAAAFVARRANDLVFERAPAPGVAVPNSAGLPLADRHIDVGVLLASGDRVAALHDRAVDEWKLLMASMLVGLSQAALDLGVGYVCERHQFGVPIGTFQAIQHGLAELPGPLSGARLLVRRGAWRIDHDDPRSGADAAMAFLFASELARTLTARVLHFHGGYGVMEEHDIGLYYRRARGWSAQLGDPTEEVDRLATILYGPAEAR
jgi:alkylation response protein AidB-like acyl-CoA dehydrogenase